MTCRQCICTLQRYGWVLPNRVSQTTACALLFVLPSDSGIFPSATIVLLGICYCNDPILSKHTDIVVTRPER